MAEVIAYTKAGIDEGFARKDLSDSESQNAILALVGGPLVYAGNWNASTNNPTLADGVGTAGTFYEVNVGGAVDLGSGVLTFSLGDFVSYDGYVWSRTSSSTANPVTDEPGLRIIRGTIDTSGSGTIVHGSGFTITRHSAGVLTVTFDESFQDVPTVLLTPKGAGSSVGPIVSHKSDFTRLVSAFKVEVVSIGSGFADGIFDFIAIGPRL